MHYVDHSREYMSGRQKGQDDITFVNYKQQLPYSIK